MDIPYLENTNNSPHSDEIHDIITIPPTWLLRWGITLFFGVLILIVGLSAVIHYPDIIKTQLQINSVNAPKPIVSRVAGKLVRLLVRDNQQVANNQPLAYLESAASHPQVLQLLDNLKKLQIDLSENKTEKDWLEKPMTLQLGEIQNSYQAFYQSYLTYKSSIKDGSYLKKRAYLLNDLKNVEMQKQQLLSQKNIQEKDFELTKDEYEIHKKLLDQQVEAKMEFKKEESKYLQSQYPLQQTETGLLNNSISYAAKQSEIMELDNQIIEEHSKFTQALNSLVSEIETWKQNYVLCASQAGIITFSGIVQENQFIQSNQEVMFINPGSSDFFGEMNIPQFNMGKVKEGQSVLIKLKSYPFEEYGVIKGKISYISEIPVKDSIFISKVNFKRNYEAGLNRSVKLKTGMMADAEIITEDASLISRLSRSIIKMLK